MLDGRGGAEHQAHHIDRCHVCYLLIRGDFFVPRKISFVSLGMVSSHDIGSAYLSEVSRVEVAIHPSYSLSFCPIEHMHYHPTLPTPCNARPSIIHARIQNECIRLLRSSTFSLPSSPFPRVGSQRIRCDKVFRQSELLFIQIRHRMSKSRNVPCSRARLAKCCVS